MCLFDFEVTLFGGQARGAQSPVSTFRGTFVQDSRTGRDPGRGSFSVSYPIKLAAVLLSSLTLFMIGGSLLLLGRSTQPQDARTLLMISAAGSGALWLFLLAIMTYGRRQIRRCLQMTLQGARGGQRPPLLYRPTIRILSEPG